MCTVECISGMTLQELGSANEIRSVLNDMTRDKGKHRLYYLSKLGSRELLSGIRDFSQPRTCDSRNEIQTRLNPMRLRTL